MKTFLVIVGNLDFWNFLSNFFKVMNAQLTSSSIAFVFVDFLICTRKLFYCRLNFSISCLQWMKVSNILTADAIILKTWILIESFYVSRAFIICRKNNEWMAVFSWLTKNMPSLDSKTLEEGGFADWFQRLSMASTKHLFRIYFR